MGDWKWGQDPAGAAAGREKTSAAGTGCHRGKWGIGQGFEGRAKAPNGHGLGVGDSRRETGAGSTTRVVRK